jgi:hypothetical protein
MDVVKIGGNVKIAMIKVVHVVRNAESIMEINAWKIIMIVVADVMIV